MSGAVRLERAGRVARLVIDQPGRRNAMARSMWRAVPGLVAQAAADQAVAVLRLEGEGEHFCAGADISEFAITYASHGAALAANAEVHEAVEALAALSKPTIAVVRGSCVGGGVALALACDLRLALPDARFAVTAVRLGLTYAPGDTRRLVRAIGAARAKEMLFSARHLAADEAARIGLVERVVTEEEAAGFIAALAGSSRPALRGIKRMVNAVEAGAEGAPELHALFEQSFAGEDFREGCAAFLQKRTPRFRAS
jgi:enoyl-CoA hydratase/carnithine racemase